MKKAFTFIEIIGVIALIGILTLCTVLGVNTVWQNNRIDVCESELRDMTTAFKSYFTDYGLIVIDPDSNYNTVLAETVNILNRKYLPYEIVVKEIADDKRSVTLETKIKEDPWGKKYTLSIYTYSGDDASSVSGIIVISSNGVDNKGSSSTYTDGKFGDDVIAVIEPNE